MTAAKGDKVDYLIRSKATDLIQLHRYIQPPFPLTTLLTLFHEIIFWAIQYVHFMIYAPIMFYFSEVGLIFMNFPITQQLHYRRCLHASCLKKKTRTPPNHTLHPTFLFNSCRHQIYSEVMGIAMSWITEHNLLLIPSLGHDDNKNRIHIDFHIEIQGISCLHNRNISTLLF